MDIGVVRISSGWVARPKTAGCGTCGWYPFAWTMCSGSSPNQAFANFVKEHEHKTNERMVMVMEK